MCTKWIMKDDMDVGDAKRNKKKGERANLLYSKRILVAAFMGWSPISLKWSP